jgi:hypothetical protein
VLAAEGREGLFVLVWVTTGETGRERRPRSIGEGQEGDVGRAETSEVVLIHLEGGQKWYDHQIIPGHLLSPSPS